MIPFALAVLSHTPLWVWLILAALVALGLRQARDHTVAPTRLWIQPVVLGALSLSATVSAFGAQALPLAGWLAGVLLGVAANQPLRLPRQVHLLPDGRLSIGGSWVPMLLLMLIFWLRYAVAVSLTMSPTLAGEPVFVALAGALYGAASGLFGARAWRALQQRGNAPTVAATTA